MAAEQWVVGINHPHLSDSPVNFYGIMR